MAEQEEQVEAVCADEDEDDNPDYKAPAPKSLGEILKQDTEDESLKNYKKKLLAEAECGETIIHDESNPLNAIVKKFAIVVMGDKEEEMQIDLTLPKEELKKTKLNLPEGCKYRLKISFFIQRDIVTGLKYEQKVYRKGIRVDKHKHMVGSYGPKKEEHVYQSAPEDAAAGLLARGDYKVESCFTDDDGHKYLEWEWHFSIKK